MATAKKKPKKATKAKKPRKTPKRTASGRFKKK